MAEPLPGEDQSPASGFQSDMTGEEVMAALALATTSLQDPGAFATAAQGTLADTALQSTDLAPIASYTETGATLTFVAAPADTEIPGDGKVYSLVITGNCNLTTPAGLWPTAPECANVEVKITINTATPPTITTPASWNWPDKIRQLIPTENGAKCVLQIRSFSDGDMLATLLPFGVPA